MNDLFPTQRWFQDREATEKWPQRS